MTHSKIKVALLLARVAEEVSQLAETSDDLQITVSELLSTSAGSSIGSHGILTLQEIDRISQTLKGLSGLMQTLSQTETDNSISETEVRVSSKLDSLADRLLGIVAEANETDDMFWAGDVALG